MNLLTHFGVDWEVLDHSQNLPLHKAVVGAQLRAAQMLVRMRSDPHQCNADGRSAIRIANDLGNIAMANALVRAVKQRSMVKPLKDAHDDFELGECARKWTEIDVQDPSAIPLPRRLAPVVWIVPAMA